MLGEPELLLAPEFFTSWAAEHPSVAGLDIEVKRGLADNELNRYRYDVTIHKTPTPVRSLATAPTWAWTQAAGLRGLRTELVSQRPTAVRVTEIAANGTIPGAVHMPRGNLEFWIDPASPYFKPVFGSGKSFVFFCAAALRSTLAAATAIDMGLPRVSHIGGGFHAWRTSGAPIATTVRAATEVDVQFGVEHPFEGGFHHAAQQAVQVVQRGGYREPPPITKSAAWQFSVSRHPRQISANRSLESPNSWRWTPALSSNER